MKGKEGYTRDNRVELELLLGVACKQVRVCVLSRGPPHPSVQGRRRPSVQGRRAQTKRCSARDLAHQVGGRVGRGDVVGAGHAQALGGGGEVETEPALEPRVLAGGVAGVLEGVVHGSAWEGWERVGVWRCWEVGKAGCGEVPTERGRTGGGGSGIGLNKRRQSLRPGWPAGQPGRLAKAGDARTAQRGLSLCAATSSHEQQRAATLSMLAAPTRPAPRLTEEEGRLADGL